MVFFYGFAGCSQLPGASKSQIWASILKDQEITVAQIMQTKGGYDFHYKNNSFSLWTSIFY